MKKTSPFHEAKPRTAKGEAHKREAETMRKMAELADLDDEAEFRNSLEELFGIKPGHPKYQKAMATWAEIRRGRP